MGCRSCPQKHTMGVRSQFHSLPPSWASPRSWSTDSSSAVSLSATPLWTPYFPHPCIFSHNSPQATNYGPNPKSDLSGLLHMMIRTSHTPTKDSTSPRSWTLEQVTNPFICPWSAPFVSVQLTSWNGEGCLKVGKEKKVLRAASCHGFLTQKVICEIAEPWKDAG